MTLFRVKVRHTACHPLTNNWRAKEEDGEKRATIKLMKLDARITRMIYKLQTHIPQDHPKSFTKIIKNKRILLHDSDFSEKVI